MAEKKTDRRILKTKRVLRESLLYLLKEQPIQKISVSLLCKKSDINRSTFYTYYSSPMNLLESIEDEILNTLEEDMIQFEKENSISQLMNSIIFYISEHKQLVRLLFSDHGDPGFQNKLLFATQRWTMPMWQSRRPDYDAETLSSLHIYIVSGCMAVIRQWITGGFQESEEEVSLMLEKLSASTSVGFLQGKYFYLFILKSYFFHNTYCCYNHQFFHLKMNYKLIQYFLQSFKKHASMISICRCMGYRQGSR